MDQIIIILLSPFNCARKQLTKLIKIYNLIQLDFSKVFFIHNININNLCGGFCVGPRLIDWMGLGCCVVVGAGGGGGDGMDS